MQSVIASSFGVAVAYYNANGIYRFWGRKNDYSLLKNTIIVTESAFDELFESSLRNEYVNQQMQFDILVPLVPSPEGASNITHSQ